MSVYPQREGAPMKVTIHDLWPAADDNGLDVTLPADATGITWDNGWTECLVIVQADHDYGRYGEDDFDRPGTVIVGRPGACDAHVERGDVWECSMASETVGPNPTINVVHPRREDLADATSLPLVWFDRYHGDENAGWVYRDVEGLDTALDASDPGNPDEAVAEVARRGWA
jgi:hypothetical protein